MQWRASPIVLCDEVGVCLHDLLQELWIPESGAAIELNGFVPRLWRIPAASCHIPHSAWPRITQPDRIDACDSSRRRLQLSRHTMKVKRVKCWNSVPVREFSVASGETVCNVGKVCRCPELGAGQLPLPSCQWSSSVLGEYRGGEPEEAVNLQDFRRAVMKRVQLWLSVKHLCQGSSPLLRHHLAAPQLETILCSSFATVSRNIVPAHSLSEEAAADSSHVVSGAKASASGNLNHLYCRRLPCAGFSRHSSNHLRSCAGPDLLSQPHRPYRWGHTAKHSAPPQSTSLQHHSALDGRSTYSSAASPELRHRSSEPCSLHSSSQAATVSAAQLPAEEGAEEHSMSRNLEPAWLGRASIARRERENEVTVPFSAKAFYVGEPSDQHSRSTAALVGQGLTTLTHSHTCREGHEQAAAVA